MATFQGYDGADATSPIERARKAIDAEKEKYFLPMDEGEEMAYCCVERKKGKQTVSFHLHREDSGEFVLACSGPADMDGDMFKFHTDPEAYKRSFKGIPDGADSATYLGCLAVNYLGTEFTVRDHLHRERELWSRELGLVCYDSNVSGRAPNSMAVVIPRISSADVCSEPPPPLAERYKRAEKKRFRGSRLRRWFPKTAAALGRRRADGELEDAAGIVPVSANTPTKGGSIRRSFASPRAAKEEEDDVPIEYKGLETADNLDLTVFKTKKPVWNDELKAWTLNFNGRAKRPSKKNFLLVLEEQQAATQDVRVYLRFGKMAKGKFSLDFRDPYSPVAALAVAVSTFAKKRVVT